MTTKAYSSYSSSDIVSAMSPRSTITFDTYYDTAISGCRRKCPCRTWAQCHYYNSAVWKTSRGEDGTVWKEVHEYYETFFRTKYEQGELLGNG
jgi:hypothetical protein